MSMVKPELRVLTDDQVSEIHEMAISILEKTGVRVDDQNARHLFEKAIGKQRKNDRIFIPRELSEWAIKTAPSSIERRRRDGKPGFTLDSRNTEQNIFGIGVTNLYYQGALNDEVLPFSRNHMSQATRLGDALDEFDVISTPGVIQDIDSQEAELLGSLEMLANTKKPLILLISDPKDFETCLSMYDHLVGEAACRSSVIPYFNPITPLILNEETTVKMRLTVDRGLPLIFSNYSMSGATCPITPGGTIALLVAELLAGLVYSQLLKEGTPVILGSLPAAFDMKTMSSYYTSKSMLLNLACAEMMAHYQIPHSGTSGGWMGWGPDLMASSMIWSNHLTGVLGKAGLTPFVGSNFDSLVFSPANVVYASEVIRNARDMAEGFSLDGKDVGLDEIIEMGPGADYLTSKLTLKTFRDSIKESPVWPILSLEKWQEAGCPRSGETLRKYTDDLLNQITPPEDHDQILAAGEEFLARYQ